MGRTDAAAAFAESSGLELLRPWDGAVADCCRGVVGVISAGSIVRIDANQRWNAGRRKRPFSADQAKMNGRSKSGWSSFLPCFSPRFPKPCFVKNRSYPPLFEALENLPEDVSRDKTRSSFAFRNREENFHPKTILPWGVT